MKRMDKRKISEVEEEERGKKRRVVERKSSGGFWPFAIGDAARKLKRPLSFVARREEPRIESEREDEFSIVLSDEKEDEEESSSTKTVIEHPETPVEDQTTQTVSHGMPIEIQQAPIFRTPAIVDGAPPSVEADLHARLRSANIANASLLAENATLRSELEARKQQHKRFTAELRRICDR